MTRSKGAFVAIAGAVIAAGGTVLPWIQATAGFASLTRNGLELGGDALVILGLAIVVGLVAVLASGRLAGGIEGPVAALLLIVAWFDLTNLQRRVDDVSGQYVSASVGGGIYLVFAGALTILAGAFVTFREGLAEEWAEPDTDEGAVEEGSPSAIADLERLAALRDASAITPEEFEAKKADLLARI